MQAGSKTGGKQPAWLAALLLPGCTNLDLISVSGTIINQEKSSIIMRITANREQGGISCMETAQSGNDHGKRKSWNGDRAGFLREIATASLEDGKAREIVYIDLAGK